MFRRMEFAPLRLRKSCCLVLLALTGCESASQTSTFVQDFARQVLAAFLL